MCSIVRLTGEIKAIYEVKHKIFNNSEQILSLLKTKGGDTFGVKILNVNETYSKSFVTIQDDDYDTFRKKVYHWIEQAYIGANDSSKRQEICMMFHSRQTPEMEGNLATQQPYFIDTPYDLVAVHGTIPNVSKIEEKYNMKFAVDTDIFAAFPFEEACLWVEELQGKITAISIDREYSNGLGLYKFEIRSTSHNLKICTNISPSYYDTDKFEYVNIRKVPNMNLKSTSNMKHYVILSTGGLDATLSTLDILEHDKNIKTVSHIYFDWGSNAAESEIKTVNKFINVFKNNYTNINFGSLQVFDIKNMFKNILNVANIDKVRLNDKDAVGAGHNEAEEAISYVPFRNTYLMTLAATWAEQQFPNEEVYFVIGANLSEGMIYLDNSTEWLEAMDQVIKVGGQKCKHFKVVAPFATMTKTNMVKVMKNIIRDTVDFDIDDVFSCYFPDANGQECGVCGSCLLKIKAIIRGQK